MNTTQTHNFLALVQQQFIKDYGLLKARGLIVISTGLVSDVNHLSHIFLKDKERDLQKAHHIYQILRDTFSDLEEGRIPKLNCPFPYMAPKPFSPYSDALFLCHANLKGKKLQDAQDFTDSFLSRAAIFISSYSGKDLIEEFQTIFHDFKTVDYEIEIKKFRAINTPEKIFSDFKKELENIPTKRRIS